MDSGECTVLALDGDGVPDGRRASVGGVSDGNLTAGLGVPTLDGLGAVGGGAHADDEHVVIAATAERAALLRGLIERLG
jgi:glutamate carboxypeptidase